MIDPEVMRRLEQQASLIRQLQGALGGTRIVRGVVDATSGTPNISEGAGFTITDNATGDYTINFDPAFSDIPTVTAIINRDSSGANYVRLHGSTAVTASAARVVSFTFAGTPQDCEFHFIAIGPA